MEESAETREKRRGAFGRVLRRIKNALKGRSATTQASPAGSSVAHAKPSQNVPAAQLPATEQSKSAESVPDQPIAQPEQAVSSPDVSRDATKDKAEAPLILDAGQVIEIGDENEPVLPLTARSGITAARARAVFDKYGIKYETVGSSMDEDSLATKIRRVEKPIRIRIHWNCHECRANFGLQKVCGRCGHRRCKECPRTPAKRVRDALQGTRQWDELDEQLGQTSESQEAIPVTVTAEQAAVIAEDLSDKGLVKDAFPPSDGGGHQDRSPAVPALPS